MRIRLAATTLAAASLIIGCSSDKTAGDGGGTVIVAMPAEPVALFPLLSDDEMSRTITDVVFARLAKLNDRLSTVGDAGFTPQLASSWDWSRDSLSIAFHIKPTARFHDGSPVTAKDVQYTFRIAKDTMLGSNFTQLIANVDSVTAVDSLTPVFWFHRRAPTQFYDAVYQLAPLPEHVYSKVAVADIKTSDLIRNPVGTGRFRFVKWEPGVRLELMADTANVLGRAKLDRVIFMLGQAPTSAAASVLAGDIDFFSSFPIDQADRLDSNTTVRALPYSQNGYGFLGMNPQNPKAPGRPHPILSDPAVRRALSMSLDRRAMLANVFKSAGRLAYGPFPTGAELGDTTIQAPAYDTTAAGAALDAAGWRRGADGVRMKNGRPLALEILVPTVSLPRMRYAELIQEQLKRAGFKVELARVAPAEFTPRLNKGDFELILLTLNTDASVAGIQQYWSKPADGPGTNYLKYHSAAVDADLDSASRANDLPTIKRYTSRAFKRIVDDVPAVWLYSAGTIAAVNRRIDVAPFGLDGWWTNLADWSIPADKRIDRDRVGLRPATP